MRVPSIPCIVGVLLAASGCATVRTPAPQVGFAVEAATLSCRADGPVRTVERNVYGADAVARVAAGGTLEVVLDDGVEPCLHVAFGDDGSRVGTVLGPCPPPRRDGPSAASNAFESYEARTWLDRDGAAHVVLGFVTYDWPHAAFGVAHEGRARLVEHRFIPPLGGPGGGEDAPALASLGEGDSGFLLVWVEGGSVRAQPLAHGAEAAGLAFDVARMDTGHIGSPSVVFGPNGRGLVAFAAETPHGDDAFAMRVQCGIR